MDLSMMNEMQRQGVVTTEGPVLILAGAGSGKTRVLTHRVAYLIEQGVKPYNIMAITFTNKAAKEMKERIDDIVGFGSDSVWCMTFHASCVRILRHFGERIGYDYNFTIYDTDDCKSIMKDVCKYLNIDTKKYKEKTFLNIISAAKNELISAEEYGNRYNDYKSQINASVYREYQARLRQNNAMDFDDLIMNTVRLFRLDAEALNYYQSKFHYVMVDEYQDTNTAQFELVRFLAGGRENLCVVGDDDQSIYKFRGANIYNILNFERHYPRATVIKLEQNYRSTANILNAANGVIHNNEGRKDKTLWTKEDAGEKIRFEQFDSAYEEASFVASDISSNVSRGKWEYKDNAVLYRTNAQSRAIEEKLIFEGIPYKIVGGINFYSRKEIKDLIAYMKTVDNGKDDLAVQRIINIPKRGIGATTISRLTEFAINNNMNFYDALEIADEISSISSSTVNKINPFVELIMDLRDIADKQGISALMEEIIDRTGYVEELEAENTDEAKARIENINELITKCADYEHNAEQPTLSGFLEEVALVADIDSLDESEDYVVLMTLHGAKGLEFPRVYMVGMEDGLFPSYNAIFDEGTEDSELEEERRLCYVGITRAREELMMTCARMRMIRGEIQYGKISRFVKEIPKELIKGNLWEEKPRDEGPKYSGYGEYSPYNNSAAGSLSRAPLAATTYSANTKGTKIEKKELDYSVGDRVKHIKFKEGTVLDIIDEGRDYEVTVQFDGAGVKKMFASFAKLVKV